MSDLVQEAEERYARILSALPEELHARARSGGRTLMNIRGGRPSDNLDSAVRELREMQATQTLDRETSWEEFARRDRERTQRGWSS